MPPGRGDMNTAYRRGVLRDATHKKDSDPDREARVAVLTGESGRTRREERRRFPGVGSISYDHPFWRRGVCPLDNEI